jgi:DNA invertase Pin-like site-specific DNA recombinase
MTSSAVALSKQQARRLDLARRRRGDGHEAVEDEWVQAVTDLVSDGVSVKAIANHLDVSRQTVYDWLRKADQRS